jgi:hypothetical protein
MLLHYRYLKSEAAPRGISCAYSTVTVNEVWLQLNDGKANILCLALLRISCCMAERTSVAMEANQNYVTRRQLIASYVTLHTLT